MNTLLVIAKLAEKYKYKPLPSELSTKYRAYFKDNIPSRWQAWNMKALNIKLEGILNEA